MPLGVGEEHLTLHDTVARWASSRAVLGAARACLDRSDDHEALPPFWTELSELGWLGLHLPEAHGGQGYGLAELGVVLEALGAAAAPGPFLPTVLAGAVIARLGADRHGALLKRLATGETTAAVALSPPRRPVLGAPLADVLVVPVDRPASAASDRTKWAGNPVLGRRDLRPVRWGVVPSADVTVTPLRSLDVTRRVARVDLGGLTIADADLLDPEPFPGWVEAIAALLLAAESVGGASWCVDTAAAWARDRVQFGRPIGQFQAVKHRCADMLCRLELARAAVWDGLRAADESMAAAGQEDEAGRAVALAAAAALGPDAFFRCAEDAVQVLGGIGFTWDHDAHILLKRAAANRLLAGSPEQWRARASALAAGGARRGIVVDIEAFSGSDKAAKARAEVQAFAADLHDRPKSEWRAALVTAGYATPHWPRPWGRSAEPIEQLVIDQELRAANIRRPHLGIAGWVLPTLIAHGTDEQQERWIRPTLSGELSWCQLFSEPGAGSDLASVSTRATRVDGGWRLEGQKVWTTFAHVADLGLCVARSDPDAPKHEGLSCFVVDMRAPGIDIRPLRELTGAEMFNEVFFDGVFVPDDAVVGPVNGGWNTARTTLENERVSMGSGSSFGPGVEALVGLLGDATSGNATSDSVTNGAATAEPGAVPADPTAMDKVGALVVESHALAALGVRMTLRALVGGGAGPEASVRKLLGVEHDQRVQEVGMLLYGPVAAGADGEAATWVNGFLANRCLTIAGGTSEIQRNVIGERLLGLPRDAD